MATCTPVSSIEDLKMPVDTIPSAEACNCFAVRASPPARRAKELHLTNAGERRFQAARKRWVAAQARFESTFGTKRAADMRALLRAAVASEFARRTKTAVPQGAR